MENLNYPTDHALYQIFKIISSNYFKTHKSVIDDTLTRICVNQIENRIIFRIKIYNNLE